MDTNVDTTARLDTLLQRLRQGGNRLTPQRLAIVRALLAHRGHPTVEQLHQAILPDFPTTSLATVYKTIALLKDQGEVLELGFGELGNRYDGRRPAPHPHLVCTRCGAVVDPEEDGQGILQSLVDFLARQSGFAVSTHRLELFGLCPACRKPS